MSEAAIADTIVKYAPDVVKTLKELGVFDDALAWISSGTRSNVLVLGVSGTGKTSFVDDIFGRYSKRSGEFMTAKNKSHFGKIDRQNLHFWDTPGQTGEPYRGERKAAIRQASTLQPLGIINVVSYGYHEGPIENSKAVDRDKVKVEFLDRRRQEEIEQLNEWTDFLCGRDGNATWVITVVTKADLWWSPAAFGDVLDHYNRGAYLDRIVAAGPVSHKVLPYCSTFKPFFDVVPMSGYYSDEKRKEHHNELLANLLANCASP
jgi:hypothetical protein